MEFWSAEVKSGVPVKVTTGRGMVLHLSQASVGDAKKDKASEGACLFVNVNGKKLVLATLFSDRLPQQQFDLVFDRDFELSHNWKAGSVYFYGYRAVNPLEDPDESDFSEFESDEDAEELEEDDSPLPLSNGKPEAKAEEEKPVAVGKAKAGKDSAAGKQKVKIVEPSKDDDSEEESDEDMDSDDDMDEDSDDSEEDGESEDEETPTPKKPVPQAGKKRAAESASKTPVPEKKAKLVTPQKSDGKKGGGHVATPHPSKQAGKTPANKSDQKSPKSSGSFPCGPCKKTFTSETALQSHSKAKHSAGK